MENTLAVVSGAGGGAGGLPAVGGELTVVVPTDWLNILVGVLVGAVPGALVFAFVYDWRRRRR
jgi:hypothetical protein